MTYDQLLNERKAGRVFAHFHEGAIDWAPTYRMLKGELGYSNKRNQNPSYCDRILWKTSLPSDIELMEYRGVHKLMHSGKYSSEGAAREWSTVVDIFIPPPYLKPVLLSFSRFPLF